MRLISSSNVLYIVSILHCFVAIGHGRPSAGRLDHESRLRSRQQPDLPRKIILVADKLLEGPVAASTSSDDSVETWQGQGTLSDEEGEKQATDEELVYSVHSWIYFNETATEGALRVELVTPLTVSPEGLLEPRGLAIAVTDYGNSRYDTGVPGDPSQPRNTSRSSHTFSESVSVTNDGIFNLTGLLSAASEPDSERARSQLAPGLVEANWIRSTFQWHHSEQAEWQVGHHFGNAHDFSMVMLSEPMQREPLVNREQLFSETIPFMTEGEEWALLMRSNTRTLDLGSDEDEVELGSADEHSRDDLSSGQVDYLFYEAVASSTQRKSGLRMVFELAKIGAPPQYGLREVTDKRWAHRWVSEVSPPTLPTERRPVRNWRGAGEVIELSRDPRLTSDVLMLNHRGSLHDVP